MKKIFTAFLIFFTISLYAQNFDEKGNIITLDNLGYRTTDPGFISFTHGEMILQDWEKGNEADNYVVLKVKYKIENKGKLTYLILEDGTKYLCLANSDMLFLYNNKKTFPVIEGYRIHEESIVSTFNDDNIYASSELHEGMKIYSAKNLYNLNLDSPWVESADGNGIGEYFGLFCYVNIIYLFNGFVSYNKPYLYEENSRPKRIRISYSKSGIQRDFELEDTPNPQKIVISGESVIMDKSNRPYEDIKVEIIEVYEGTKYTDTCINGIVLQLW